MNQYEVMYIVDATLEETTIQQTIERFTGLVTSNGGQMDKIDEWGKRRLAYPIRDINEGYYVLMDITGDPELPKELERNFQISENILRSLVIRKDA